MKHFAAISKIDEAARMVWGYASTEAVDSQGEIVTRKAMEGAWADYMKFANVREMHGPSAAGIVKEHVFDDTGVMIGAYIVDDQAWKKVVEGVYKGFSIGGSKLPGGYDVTTKTITGLRLTEISLVDRPANPEALITVWKADNLEDTAMSKAGEQTPVDKLTDMIAKGEITQERLLELAAQDINKTAQTPVVVAEVETPEPTATEEAPETPVEKAEVVEEVVAEKPQPLAALRKSMQDLLLKGDDVAKGLYSVSCLADLITQLKWLQQDIAWEAEMEADGSAMPAKMAAAIKVLCGLLCEIAAEECGELTEGMGADADPMTILNTAVANSEVGKDLLKFNDAYDVLKAGARNSKADADKIQKAHDLMMSLGAECPEPATVKDATKADGLTKHDHGDISKMAGTLEKLAGELGTLRKSHDTLLKEHGELVKKFAATPTEPKGSLKIVEKSADAKVEELAAVVVEPVRKSDGSIDEAATAMKKVHAGGGRPIFG